MHIVVGILIAVGLSALLSALLLIMLDYMALAFLWVAPMDPSQAWLLTGIVLGGLVGVAFGFRRGGRPLGALGPALPILAAAGLLIAGAGYPIVVETPAETRTAFVVRVTAVELNVRRLPDPTAQRVGRLSRGAVVEVAEASGEWYRLKPSSLTPGGWIHGRYVVPVQDGPREVVVPSEDTSARLAPARTSTAPRPIPASKVEASKLPSSSTQRASLVGPWRGRFDGYPANLYIDWQDGPLFSGALEVEASRAAASQGRFRVAVEGEVKSGGGVVIRETAVVSAPMGHQWELGLNSGTLSSSGITLSGRGKSGGATYEWFFERN
jgi:hypothetical protein